MRARILFLISALLWPVAAAAQHVTVIGPITAGHVPVFNSSTVIKDGGSAPTPNAITALTGDGTATGPGSVPFTLATVNSNVGTFGSALQWPIITVDGKGRITAASNSASNAIRKVLATNTTFYVRSDGSDTQCNGTVNVAFSGGVAPACAMLTWNNLYLKVAQTIDFNGFTVTLTSGTTGPYAAGLFMNTSWVGGGSLTIDLAGSSIAETVTKGFINNVVQPGPFTLQSTGATGTISSTAFACIQNAAPSNMYIGAGITIGTCNEADIEAVNGANIFVQATYNVSGASGAGNASDITVGFGSFLSLVGASANFLNDRTYSIGYVRVLEGYVYAPSYTATLNGHTVTGARYAAQNQGSFIYTNGGGANFFPGTTAGTIDPGSCYDTNCPQLVGTTGLSGGNSNGVVYDNAGLLATTAAGTNGQLFLGVTSGGPQFATMSGDCTITNAGVISCHAASSTTTSTITCQTGSLTGGATATWHYWQAGKLLQFSVTAAPTYSSCTNNLILPLPLSLTGATYIQSINGSENVGAYALNASLGSGATAMNVFKYDGTFPLAASGHSFTMTGQLEVQ